MITTLKPNEYFVFGSNTRGAHGKGAARQAYIDFGAKWGVGEGLTGQCYAFPTLDGRLRKLTVPELRASVERLYACCAAHPEKRFLLTKVGCGLAGYPEDLMHGLFSEHPHNLILPKDWSLDREAKIG